MNNKLEKQISKLKLDLTFMCNPENPLDGMVVDRGLMVCKYDFVNHHFVDENGNMDEKQILQTSYNNGWLKIYEHRFDKKLFIQFQDYIDRVIIGAYWNIDGNKLKKETIIK